MPRAIATAGSTLANSNGRAIAASTTISPRATSTATSAAEPLMPKIDPNSTVTLAVPLPALECRV